MQTEFYALADHLVGKLKADEVLLLSFSGEASDFVRLSKSKVRQPGHVSQRALSADLVSGGRHAPASIALSGDPAEDRARGDALLATLRARIPELPEDPHLLYATEVRSTEQHGENRLPDAEEALGRILAAGEGRDLVGIYAHGPVYSGFANSLGQRNWFSSTSFHLDWSFYHHGDKAVKCAYAGFEWDDAAFRAKVDAAAEQLSMLGSEPKTIPAGRYRVYMAPVALADYVGMLGWGGLGLKSHRTKQSSLLRMTTDGQTLHPSVTLTENTRDGTAPNFQGQGFLKPDVVTMISEGRYRDSLVSPRSAKEYGVPTNGANGPEAPESLDLAAGDLPAAEVLSRLDTGVLVNNVWYLNWSDRPACRITGMTRFACFWVEGGKIQAPLSVMRFDETLFRALGENLIGLTKEREFIPDASTYGGRSTASARFPGALIDDFHFNL